MQKYQLSLFIFQNDLRVKDNLALQAASDNSEKLICCYCFDQSLTRYGRYGIASLGKHRLNFLMDSLESLRAELEKRGQQLLILRGSFEKEVTRAISELGADAVFVSEQQGVYERRHLDLVKKRFPFLSLFETPNNTLFSEDELPFLLTDLPTTFSQFRKQVEPLKDSYLLTDIKSLAPTPKNFKAAPARLSKSSTTHQMYRGGELAALSHLKNYFSEDYASDYKQTRNALDDFQSSTKFSPWLALGCMSARQVMSALRSYEQQHEANESTYWISFELLWREFFFWYAKKHGAKLFAFKGLSTKSPKTSFYPERFQKWCSGNTPFPIVNACMKQLNATGYMSNRGRQLVASCFVHELGLDWRYGAAYFEHQLIDYDVSSNWGNWQYLAGVGADPRGHRRFNLEKQTAQYDPEGEFIKRWGGNIKTLPIDSVDAADWPVKHDEN
ncbi:deoxyribodipyrimidine photolyase [Idiomarina piscisalsi]|uniref:Cryptochrome DASH n=1 Tax=Idiomarina piscisalsi TaxID=1096243 RepID=A0ABM6LW73_9GAMM|nr:DASH family cryptochrome [Idiomarina piscisalsi]ASG66779.1 deoxyribodipyrimidine photolyase [Idiomarina piscisalsi]